MVSTLCYRSGLLDQLVGLKATAYLKDEVEFSPWRTAIRNLAYIELMLSRTATMGLFEVGTGVVRLLPYDSLYQGLL